MATESAQVNEMAIDPKKAIAIRYTNYKGETGVRRIIPLGIRFAVTEWHPEEQWLLEAFDLDRNAQRSFALKDILEWSPRCAGSCNHGHAAGS